MCLCISNLSANRVDFSSSVTPASPPILTLRLQTSEPYNMQACLVDSILITNERSKVALCTQNDTICVERRCSFLFVDLKQATSSKWSLQGERGSRHNWKVNLPRVQREAMQAN